jgi:hypothetical protein
MTHFGIHEWVDYARGVVDQGRGSTMREHLEAGCADCGRVAAFCQSLARVCGAMVEAPDSVARLAAAICPARASTRARHSLRIPVELIYDSFLVPAPAGLRATWQVGWQALYRAGDCSLDVRIEPDLRSSRAAVIGQVFNHALPELGMGNIPVCLRSGRQVVAETLSNRFGEFQMEYDQQSRLQLWIYLDGGARRIVAPLRKIAAQGPSGCRWSMGAGGESEDGEKSN